jgi:hypothetical protein
LKRTEIPLSEVLPEPAGGLNTGLQPPEPPIGIGHYYKFRWAKEIKCVAVIPDYEVSTAKARDALPMQYSRSDMVYNMQRIALLATALGQSPPDPDMIFEAMKDKGRLLISLQLSNSLSTPAIQKGPDIRPRRCLEFNDPENPAWITRHLPIWRRTYE